MGNHVPKKILLVDDNKFDLNTISNLLRSKGYETQTAENGSVAMKLLHQDTGFDVVITDLHMPEMTGIELLGNIRSDITKELMALGLTAYEDYQYHESMLMLGADAVFMKSVEYNDLLEFLASA